jgi:hypothetical protein
VIFTREKPAAARDLHELRGDPFVTGVISDAPADMGAVNDALERYDQMLDQATINAGVAPGSPAWEATRSAIEATHVIGPRRDDFPQHGDQLPMTARQFAAYSGQTTRDVLDQQDQFHDALWAEYRDAYGDAAADDPKLAGAVDSVMADLKRNGQSPARYAREHTTDFLRDVDMARQLGHTGPASHDSGRTGGIAGGGGYAPDISTSNGNHPLDDADNFGMVSELRELQRKRGIV